MPVGLLTDRFWPPGQRFPKLREPIYVNVGEPIRLAAAPDDPNAARAGTDRVMTAIVALLDEARDARAADARWPPP